MWIIFSVFALLLSENYTNAWNIANNVLTEQLQPANHRNRRTQDARRGCTVNAWCTRTVDEINPSTVKTINRNASKHSNIFCTCSLFALRIVGVLYLRELCMNFVQCNDKIRFVYRTKYSSVRIRGLIDGINIRTMIVTSITWLVCQR